MKAHELMKARETEVDLEAIKRFRGLFKVNQEEMAEQLDLTLQQYQRRENGKVALTAMELKMIAIVLGQSVDFFYTDYKPEQGQRS